jgi:hypothetical protein
MVFEVPQLKSPAVHEEWVGAILRDSVLTSLQNRTSVGYLLDLPVDIESILINGGWGGGGGVRCVCVCVWVHD